MNQVLLYSINSEYLISILNGHKTIEVRKRDLPQWAKDKLARGEKVVGYGYCTKSFPYIEYVDFEGDRLYYEEQRNIPEWNLNGRVVVKFEVSGTTKYVDCSDCIFMYSLTIDPILRKATCLTADEIEDYGNGADLYAHHLTNITPIEPMGLGELQTRYLIEETLKWHGEFDYVYQPLTKAPQSFMTCWVKGE